MPRIDGYEVIDRLGRGEFATVWKAVQQSTGLTVALKIIRVDLATDDIFGRFAREVELMKKLDHPGVAKIYDSHLDRKLGYYATELLTGGTLESYAKEHAPKPGALLLLVSKVCEALHHAHQRGVVHRDLKPSNIMMTPEGEPKLVDFGLARSMFKSSDNDTGAQTLDGSVIGTPLYMSPEQARGDNDTLDGRADVYALGIILYVLLLKRHPLRLGGKARWEAIQVVAEGKARAPSEFRPTFNRDLEAILMTALAKEPNERYATAADFGAAIRTFLKESAKRKRERKKS